MPLFKFLGLGPEEAPSAVERFEVDLEEFKVLVLRKSVRRLRLSFLESGQPRLSVPRRTSRRALLAFLQEQLPWLRRQKQRLLEDPRQGAPLSREEKAALRSRLEAEIPPLVERWEGKLGVKVRRWRLRDMRSRWGSCNPRTASLSFALRLGAYPPQALEYLVVHEMLHLLEGGHGPRFKSLLNLHHPSWKSSRALLGAGFAQNP